MELLDVASGARLTRIVRETRLVENSGLLPYQSAEVAVSAFEIDTLVPLAKYVLEENLNILEKVRRSLLAIDVDMFRLPGRIEVHDGNNSLFLSPPIIEHWPGEGPLICDGLHRLWLARSQGIRHVHCLSLRNISLPLVPLPVSWEAISTYPPGSYPGDAEKREYRFTRLEELDPTIDATDWGITEENLRYFFFRDLSALGSTGIREFAHYRQGKEEP